MWSGQCRKPIGPRLTASWKSRGKCTILPFAGEYACESQCLVMTGACISRNTFRFAPPMLKALFCPFSTFQILTFYGTYGKGVLRSKSLGLWFSLVLVQDFGMKLRGSSRSEPTSSMSCPVPCPLSMSVYARLNNSGQPTRTRAPTSARIPPRQIVGGADRVDPVTELTYLRQDSD